MQRRRAVLRGLSPSVDEPVHVPIDPLVTSIPKEHVAKLEPLFDDLAKKFPWFTDVTYADATVHVRSNRELTEAEHAALTEVIDGYISPERYLRMHHTVTHCATSKSTNSTTPETVMTFRFPCNDQNTNTTFNAIKSVLEFSVDDVMILLHIKTFSVNFQLLNGSNNNSLIGKARIDGTDIVREWQTSRPQGEQRVFKSIQVNDLSDIVPEHDCVWHIALGVSDPCVRVALHGVQKIFYEIF
jgi:hypothetical protein